ncbi:ATP-binding protein [Trichothermofontia sp.]
MAPNPFFVGGPTPSPYFIGRSTEIKIAFDQIRKRAHAAFYGSSGMGKSSLLKLFMSPDIWQQQGQDINQAIIVYLNCTDINPFTPTAFFREILTALMDEVEADAELTHQIADLLRGEAAIAKGDLRKLLKAIGQRDRFLLLLIDDYDYALRPHAGYSEADMLTFLSEFRNLAVHSRESRYLATIVTSFRRLTELGPPLPPSGSPWYNHYLFQLLRPFTAQEVETHFFQVNSPLFIPIAPSLKAGVLEITNGHPALLQQAGYLLYDTLQAGQIPNIEAFARDFESRTEHVFKNTWEFSTDVERVLMMLIALLRLQGRLNHRERYRLNGIDLIFSQHRRELIDLEERGVIKRLSPATETAYAFASSMMEWWVIQELETSNEAILTGRERVLLNLMSRDQVEQVQAVIRQVWQQREALQSLIEWIVRLLTT